ncbi:hypothetical protein J4438_01950 [Candidatus Woesearchaeota archaeon]|nr:hypothetical protein [Candidatus Woesearchaeota archaeon]
MVDVLEEKYHVDVCKQCGLTYVTSQVYEVVERNGEISRTEDKFDCPHCLEDLLARKLFSQLN